ncbi:metallophosphoesterase [Oerskovia sp. M15]
MTPATEPRGAGLTGSRVHPHWSASALSPRSERGARLRPHRDQALHAARGHGPRAAPGHDDLRILHFSDLHLTPTQERKIEWIRSLAALRPDFVVDTGDNMAHLDSLDPLLYALEPLLSTAPGAFVMGSNDYYAPRPRTRRATSFLMPDSATSGRRGSPPTSSPQR